MSQANIKSIHCWLSAELELCGIDAMIYTRHVLDLFLNSRYTTDLHLAEKEANIFASLPPGSNKSRKPKQRYNKRSNSFTLTDEVAWKKETAAKCLKSAVDDVMVTQGNNIESLIEELYFKLNSLHLLSDGSSSDETNVGCKTTRKRVNKENYNDAFPLLHNKSNEKQRTDSIWITKTPPLIIDNAEIEKNFEENLSKTSQNQTNPEFKPIEIKRSKKIKINNPHKEEKFPEDPNSQDPKFKGIRNFASTERYRKGRFKKRNQYLNDNVVKKSQGKHASSHQQDKENLNEKPRKIHPIRKGKFNKNKLAGNKKNIPAKSFYNNQGVTLFDSVPFYDKETTRFTHRPKFEHMKYASGQHQVESEISHLYSLPSDRLTSLTESNLNQRPISSSKWFRDPESGFLEFEPGYKNRSNETSPSVEGSSLDEKEYENWLWCPSPSLWEDDLPDSPGNGASRLETIYQSRKSFDEDVSGQLWEDYKAIFTGVTPRAEDKKPESIFEEDSCFPFSFEDSDGVDLNLNIWTSDLPENPLKITCDCSGVSNHRSCTSCVVWSSKTDPQESFGDDLTKSDLLPPKNDPVLCEPSLGGKSRENTASKKEIWLQNSQQSLNQAFELSSFLLTGQMSPEYSRKMKMGDSFGAFFGAKSFHLNELLHEMVDANLRWMFDGGLYSEQFCSETRFLPKQKSDLARILTPARLGPISSNLSTTNTLTKPTPDLNDDNESTDMTALVQNVIGAITETYSEEIRLDFSPKPPVVFEKKEINNNTVAYTPMVDHSTRLKSTENLHQTSTEPVTFASKLGASSYEHDYDATSAALLADCVTENDAWKTSLRIGNVWQAISGVRPVDIVYSEKQNDADEVLVLQPSSLTHFRPISMAEQPESETTTSNSSYQELYLSDVHGEEGGVVTSEDYIEFSVSNSPQKRSFKDYCHGCPGCDVKIRGIEMEIGNLLYGNSSFSDIYPSCHKFRPKFRKLGEDKCLQTTFEKMLDNDNRKSLSPEKANSR